jgi:hypothetical protein
MCVCLFSVNFHLRTLLSTGTVTRNSATLKKDLINLKSSNSNHPREDAKRGINIGKKTLSCSRKSGEYAGDFYKVKKSLSTYTVGVEEK